MELGGGQNVPFTVYSLPIPPDAVIVVHMARIQTPDFVTRARGAAVADNNIRSGCLAAGAGDNEIGEGQKEESKLSEHHLV